MKFNSENVKFATVWSNLAQNLMTSRDWIKKEHRRCLSFAFTEKMKHVIFTMQEVYFGYFGQ